MSTLLHDRHPVCVNCRGNKCSFEKRCNECSSWEDDVMTKYVKHMKSLANKSRSRAKCRRSTDAKTLDDRSCSSSGDLSANPSSLRYLDSAVPLSEARVEQMIASQISRLSSSFSSSMTSSFLNIEQLINDRLAHFISQDVPNRSFSAPSSVSIRQSPSQERQDPSQPSPAQDIEILVVNQRSRCRLSRRPLPPF